MLFIDRAVETRRSQLVATALFHYWALLCDMTLFDLKGWYHYDTATIWLIWILFVERYKHTSVAQFCNQLLISKVSGIIIHRFIIYERYNEIDIYMEAEYEKCSRDQTYQY